MKARLFLAALKVAVVMFFFAGCGENDAVIKDPSAVVRYDRYIDYTNGNCQGCVSHVTLEFTVMETGKKAHWELDSDDALRKLEWIQKGDCYTNPLSASNHEQVSCG